MGDSRRDLEYKKFINTNEGTAMKIVRADSLSNDGLPRTLPDREYQKFVETINGPAVLVYDPDGGGTPGEGGLKWYSQSIENDVTDVLISSANLNATQSQRAMVKFYSQRKSAFQLNESIKYAYQEFFLIWNGTEWGWFGNYFKGLVGGWDGLTFSVQTNETNIELYYTSNNMDGVYDDEFSQMNYAIEAVK